MENPGVGAYLSDMSRDQDIADRVSKTMLGYKKCPKCEDLFNPLALTLDLCPKCFELVKWDGPGSNPMHNIIEAIVEMKKNIG
jgi:hypothetical protein